MVEMKIAIETYFADHWSSTPIQWQGMKFVQPTNKQWVYVNFTPIDVETSMNGKCETNIAQIRVLTYGGTPNISLKLADDIRDFLAFYSWNNSSIVESYSTDGLGIIDMENGAFETSSLFTVESTKGK